MDNQGIDNWLRRVLQTTPGGGCGREPVAPGIRLYLPRNPHQRKRRRPGNGSMPSRCYFPAISFIPDRSPAAQHRAGAIPAAPLAWLRFVRAAGGGPGRRDGCSVAARGRGLRPARTTAACFARANRSAGGWPAPGMEGIFTQQDGDKRVIVLLELLARRIR